MGGGCVMGKFEQLRRQRAVLRNIKRNHKSDMAFGIKRIDHIAFFFFPRTYGEIMRGRKIMTDQQNTINLQMVTVNELVARIESLEGKNK